MWMPSALHGYLRSAIFKGLVRFYSATESCLIKSCSDLQKTRILIPKIQNNVCRLSLLTCLICRRPEKVLYRLKKKKKKVIIVKSEPYRYFSGFLVSLISKSTQIQLQ